MKAAAKKNDRFTRSRGKTKTEPRHVKSALDVLKNSVVFNLVSLTNKFTSAQSKMMLENFGIGVASVYVMSVLKLEPGILPSRICEVTTIDKSVASRTLNSLEKSGFVKRVADPLHSRRELWSLTQAGADFHQSYMEKSHGLAEELFHGFEAEERRITLSMLWKLQANIPRVQDYASTVKSKKN